MIELEELRNINRSKEVLIEETEKECESLQSKLVYLETDDVELNRNIETQDNVEECKNLSDELSILDPRLHNVSPECENNSEKKNDLKNHNP